MARRTASISHQFFASPGMLRLVRRQKIKTNTGQDHLSEYLAAKNVTLLVSREQQHKLAAESNAINIPHLILVAEAGRTPWASCGALTME